MLCLPRTRQLLAVTMATCGPHGGVQRDGVEDGHREGQLRLGAPLREKLSPGQT